MQPHLSRDFGFALSSWLRQKTRSHHLFSGLLIAKSHSEVNLALSEIQKTLDAFIFWIQQIFSIPQEIRPVLCLASIMFGESSMDPMLTCWKMTRLTKLQEAQVAAVTKFGPKPLLTNTMLANVLTMSNFIALADNRRKTAQSYLLTFMRSVYSGTTRRS